MGTILELKSKTATSPTTEDRKVTPRRPTNAAPGRTREYLTPGEVQRLIDAARKVGRHGHRDATLLLLA